ncbi:hypothetical protein CISG_09793 [Coccidioides immitis RMSCC 3703]|uniref:NADH dehydrogenase [ubiquinone] 1 beta subcomplex subunit 4 n=1 Tax=Coccidioides immitis RMSCC 3703 TaxID=454286 RepID=A0A0J8QN33_COCIT|nr:hypothetical protein CISG_09793 [Coccidioides immitis RMSCC 3703]
MAGPSNLHLDPALQKYYDANKNRYKYFRWTPRTAWLSFCNMALVPGIIGYIGYKTDVSLVVLWLKIAIELNSSQSNPVCLC